jgi:hypothetical protein
MKRSRRKIILTGQRPDSRNLTLDGFEFSNNQHLIFDPISLFAEIDWTDYDNNVDVLNLIYGKLFDEFVMESKPMLCYWPKNNFPDTHWFNLLQLANSAGVGIEINFLNESIINDEEIPEALQDAWKKFVLEMMESLSDDIKLNEGLEEIASLKSRDLSITIFSQKNQNKLNYFFVTSSQAIFDFQPQYEFEKAKDINYVEEFASFEKLLEKIQGQNNLVIFESSFFNTALEKVYFNTIRKNNYDINLIQEWQKSYSLN